jgi:hypothetical protein
VAEQLVFLERNLETDICGNHLIKNIKALIWASAYFTGPFAETLAAVRLEVSTAAAQPPDSGPMACTTSVRHHIMHRFSPIFSNAVTLWRRIPLAAILMLRSSAWRRQWLI